MSPIYDQHGNDISTPLDLGMQGEPWKPSRWDNVRWTIGLVLVEAFALGTLLLAWLTR